MGVTTSVVSFANSCQNLEKKTKKHPWKYEKSWKSSHEETQEWSSED